jgi:transcription elongation factor Elf1
MFKNYYITDLKNPEVDRKLLRFRCDVCGKPAKRVKKWKLHNRSFTAEFCCKSCGRRFTGRISFKKKYDGIKVNKRIIDNSAKEKTEAENTAATAENASQ